MENFQSRKSYLQIPATVRRPIYIVRATHIPTKPSLLERRNTEAMLIMETKTCIKKLIREESTYLEVMGAG